MRGFKHGDYYDIILAMAIASLGVNIFGILVFLFLFWRRLRDDYSSEIIFKTAFGILIGILISFLIWLKFSQISIFWLSFVGSVLGLTTSILVLKVKFYETFEALVISFLPWLSFVFLLNSITHSSLSSFLFFIAMLVFIFISFYLDLHYKEFTWYKSGKIGFAGIVTLGTFFITRFALAIFGIDMISFVSLKVEAVVSAVSASICFVLLYNLSRIRE